jgi:hypothetical protein
LVGPAPCSPVCRSDAGMFWQFQRDCGPKPEPFRDLSGKIAIRLGQPRLFPKTLGAFPPLRSIGWRGEVRGEVSLNGTGNYPGNVLAGYFHNPKGIVCSKPAKPSRQTIPATCHQTATGVESNV